MLNSVGNAHMKHSDELGSAQTRPELRSFGKVMDEKQSK